MKKALSLILAAIMLLTAFPFTSFAVENPAITMTPKITDATFSYLDEIYVKKYPELGLEFSFGTDADKEILQKLSDLITKDCKTDEEKAKAVAGWADRNVKYKSYVDETYYFPIDVFYYRTGNCLGLGLFISQVLRLAGVPAVFCAGTRGDMRDFVDLTDRDVDHGWVMVYYNNTWNLFDPLFEVFGTSDREFISRWYFTDFIEGVSPYYEGMNCKYVYYGYNIFYIDGRFMYYVMGKPASQYFGTAAEGGSSLNNHVPYFTKNRYAAPGGGGDGFVYLDAPDRKNTMINDECYSDGWLNYGVGVGYYAKKNGILAGCTIKEYEGQLYYLTYGSGALMLTGRSSDYTLTAGRLTYKTGMTFAAPEPTWVQKHIEDGYYISWESLDPEVASVDENGNITTYKEGYATIQVMSKDSPEDPGCYGNTFVELYILDEDKKFDYSDNILNSLADTKVIGSDSIAVKADTMVQQILSEIPEAKITDVNGKAVDAGSMLGSGMTVTLPDGESYTVVIKGDLDSNGSVTASDARLTLRASVGLEKNDAVWFKEAGNVHLDEKEQKLTASDARLILRASVRLENKDDWFNAI